MMDTHTYSLLEFCIAPRGDTALRVDSNEAIRATHSDGTEATRDGVADSNYLSSIIRALHPGRDNSAFQGALPS